MIELTGCEDVGLRSRYLPASEGLLVVFQGLEGVKDGCLVAKDIFPERLLGMQLVLNAACHAINSGSDYDELLQMLANMRTVVKGHQFDLGGEWSPAGLSAQLLVTYHYLSNKFDQQLVVTPDVSAELQALPDEVEYGDQDEP